MLAASSILLAFCCAADAGSRTSPARLVVVIDDVGYNLERGLRLVQLPEPLTLAILPSAPNARVVAEAAWAAGKEVILHQPMEALTGPGQRDALTLAMDRARFVDTLNRALATLPNSVGVSNHTGSLLTQFEEPMNWLMAHISRRGLYFLDSRTTPNTVAVAAAHNWSVPVLRRDVFLDHELNEVALWSAFERAVGLARSRGYAVLIAHPHEMSIGLLEAALPDLEDVTVVSAGTPVRQATHLEALALR